jgi:Ca-activated chloride channel family protein
LARAGRFFVLAILLAAAPLPLTSAHAANPADTPSGLITKSDPEFRGLMIKTAKHGQYVAAPLLATEVEIEITGPVARTRVRQHYLNPSKAWIEGVYVFPLADKSAVDVLRMRIGDRLIEGVIKERRQARKIYAVAKAQGKRAALLESHRPNVFMSNVANIGPGENITIEIAYQKTIPVRDGEFRLRFPMVVGPRYFPKGQSGLVLAGGKGGALAAHDSKNMTSPVTPPEEGKINPLTIGVHINGAKAVTAIKSHHHPVTITKAEDGTRWGGSGPPISSTSSSSIPTPTRCSTTWYRPAAGTNSWPWPMWGP